MFGSVPEGEMALSQLRAAGIAARLDNAQTVSVLPLHALALGGAKVMVATADGDRAREILGLLAEPSPSEDTEPEGTALLREGDAWMRRAAVAGGFGNFLPVIATLYSIALLIRHGGRPMTRRGRTLRTLALVFDGFAVVVLGLILVLVF